MTPILAALLFPTFEHHRIYAGSYGHVVSPREVVIPEVPLYRLDGVEVGWRHFTEDDFDFDELERLNLGDGDSDGRFEITGSETPVTARLYLSPEGTIAIDQLNLGTTLLGATVRRPLGDNLDLSIIGNQWVSTVAAVDTGRFQLRGLVPSELTLLGFSNTDFDEDNKLKYYISIGTGVGGEALGRVLGPLGVYGRIVGKARTFNRHQGDARNQVRHELHAEAEAGLAILGRQQAFWLSGWGELTSQYETRDAGGKDGIDRQYVAWGLRLNARLHPSAPAVQRKTEDGEGRAPVQL